MIGRKLIRAESEIDPSQLQPASLDLRISREAYRVRASFLPGRGSTIRDRLKSLNAEPVSLAGKGAVLEKGIVYVARLMERLELRPNLSGAANPESSTGRLDIFTRLIVDGGEAFDDVPLDYQGDLWLEISPRSFSVGVRAGSRLNQLRFRSRNSQQRERHTFSLDDAAVRKRHLALPLVERLARPARRAGFEDRPGRARRESRRLSSDQEQRRYRRQPSARLRYRGFLGAYSLPRRSAPDP